MKGCINTERGQGTERAYTTVRMWKRIQLIQLITVLAAKRRPRSHFLVTQCHAIHHNMEHTSHTKSCRERQSKPGHTTTVTHEWHMKYQCVQWPLPKKD